MIGTKYCNSLRNEFDEKMYKYFDNLGFISLKKRIFIRYIKKEDLESIYFSDCPYVRTH